MPDNIILLIKEVQEVKGDVKWLVKETKRINGCMREHIEEGDKTFRPQVEANSRLRKGVYNAIAWLVPANALLLLLAVIAVLNYLK